MRRPRARRRPCRDTDTTARSKAAAEVAGCGASRRPSEGRRPTSKCPPNADAAPKPHARRTETPTEELRSKQRRSRAPSRRPAETYAGPTRGDPRRGSRRRTDPSRPAASTDGPGREPADAPAVDDSAPTDDEDDGPAALPGYDRMTLAQVRGHLRELTAGGCLGSAGVRAGRRQPGAVPDAAEQPAGHAGRPALVSTGPADRRPRRDPRRRSRPATPPGRTRGRCGRWPSGWPSTWPRRRPPGWRASSRR